MNDVNVYHIDKSFMKTAILEWMAGSAYECFSEDELMEFFDLKDSDINRTLFEKCLKEYREIYGMED